MRRSTILFATVVLAAFFTTINFIPRFLQQPDLSAHEALANSYYAKEHRMSRIVRLEDDYLTKNVAKQQETPRSTVSADPLISDSWKLPEPTIASSKPSPEASPSPKVDLLRQALPEQKRPFPTLQAVSSEGKGKTDDPSQGAAFQGAEGAAKGSGKRSEKDKYHVVMSTNAATYPEWQSRICYYWYKRLKDENPDSAMGGFTRLLHSGRPDSFMEEIPTVVVDVLPPEIEDLGYVVLHRPYAFVQWVKKFSHLIVEDYVIMAEPDHLFVRPPPLWATPTKPAAYPFSYMMAAHAPNEKVIRKYNPKGVDIHKFYPIGNSPVMMHKLQLAEIVDHWYELALKMQEDADARAAFGWILEMYAFSIASATREGGPIIYDIHPEFAVQPPWDSLQAGNGLPAYIIHYTYGIDYNEKGEFTPGKVGTGWHWDKRDSTYTHLKRHIVPPPPAVKNDAVITLIRMLNEAMDNIKPWYEEG